MKKNIYFFGESSSITTKASVKIHRRDTSLMVKKLVFQFREKLLKIRYFLEYNLQTKELVALEEEEGSFDCKHFKPT